MVKRSHLSFKKLKGISLDYSSEKKLTRVATQSMISEIFCNISPLDNNYYLVKSYNNKYALANKCGSLISDFVYDDFSLWSDSSNSIYRYSINGKKGLKTLPQNDVLACEFDNIGNLTNEFAIAIEKENGKNKYFVINKDGSFITTYTYDNLVKEKDGTYKAYLGADDNALCVILDPITGKEKNPTIQEQFFYQVVDVEMEPKEMIETYDLIIEMGGPLTAAYNNKGVAYEELHDISKARECYEKAKSLGNETAADNVKRLDEEAAAEAEERRMLAEQERQERERKRQENLNEVVDLINSWASLLGGGSNTSSSGTSSYSSSDSDNSYSSSSSSTSSKVRANDKCQACLGSGKCTTHNAHSKSTCGGNGKCGTCGGTGVFHVAGALNVLCPNCDKNHNGKCRRCHGTGKCPKCNGTGIK